MTCDLVVITYRPAGSDRRRFIIRQSGWFDGTSSPEQATRFDRREAERMLHAGYFSTFDARIEDPP